MNKRYKIAVVTGATSGIGRATALALAGLGMALALVGRNERRLKEIAAQTRALSCPRVEAYRVDLLRDDDIQRLTTDVQRDFGATDVLIHSAGVFYMGSTAHAPLAELDALYRTNVRAPYALTQALLPMLSSRRGQIVFVNSSVGLVTHPNIGAYAASKHALKAIADSLRAEVNPAGVRVISIYPGRTATPQQERIHEQEGKVYRPELLLQPEDVATTIANALSISRSAEVTDISVRPMEKA